MGTSAWAPHCVLEEPTDNEDTQKKEKGPDTTVKIYFGLRGPLPKQQSQQMPNSGQKKKKK
jgi:hypothetical protein